MYSIGAIESTLCSTAVSLLRCRERASWGFYWWIYLGHRKSYNRLGSRCWRYLGAGGGGAAAQGGGLMIRPHLGLKYDLNWSELGLNYTYVDFPNGDISSEAIALSLDIPFSSPTFNLGDDGLNIADHFGAEWSNISRHRSHLAARFRTYSPSSGSKTTSGGNLNDSLGLIGVEYSYFLDKNWFATFETAGAASGGVGGYAELLAGIGYRFPLTKNDRLALLPAVTIGGAGGGQVDTGGGFVTRANLGLEYSLSPLLSIIMEGGYLTAPDGNFDTSYAGLNLAYVMETFAKDQKGEPLTKQTLYKLLNGAFGQRTNGILMLNGEEALQKT